MTETKKGELYILSETLLWGLFPVITLLSFNTLKPLASLALSSLVAAIFFACVITYKKLWHEVFNKKAFLDILWGTFFIGIVFYLLQFIGLKYTTAGNAALVSLMEIFFSFLVFNLWKKEYLDGPHVFGAILMLCGALIVLLPKSSHVHGGDFIILLSTVAAPLGNIFQQRARKTVSSYTVMFLRNALSFPVILVLAMFVGQGFSVADVSKTFWILLINGIFLLGVSKILWLEAIHRIPVVKANAINCIGPLFTLLFAYIFLKQSPTLWQLLAIIPLFFGVIIITKSSKT